MVRAVQVAVLRDDVVNEAGWKKMVLCLAMQGHWIPRSSCARVLTSPRFTSWSPNR